jgi:hypothetical protein
MSAWLHLQHMRWRLHPPGRVVNLPDFVVGRASSRLTLSEDTVPRAPNLPPAKVTIVTACVMDFILEKQ